MGMEDDFLQNDVDDEKTIEYIKNYLPQELKEKFSDDEFYYFLDLIDEYYSESGMRIRIQMGTSRLIWRKSWTILSRKPIKMGWVTMIRKKSFSSCKVKWSMRNLWTKNSLYQKYRKIADKRGFIRDFCFYVADGVFRKKKMDVPMRMTPNTP